MGLAGLEEAGHPDVAAAVRAALRAGGLIINDRVQWPMFRCEAIRERWSELSTTALPLFFNGIGPPGNDG